MQIRIIADIAERNYKFFEPDDRIKLELSDMTIEELKDILAIDESYRIERTVSTGNMDKFQEAICAFANDLPGKRQKGYLLMCVGHDTNLVGSNPTAGIYRQAKRTTSRCQ